MRCYPQDFIAMSTAFVTNKFIRELNSGGVENVITKKAVEVRFPVGQFVPNQ